ncbi:MAG: hypothetical protein JXM74_09250 [Fusobacteriaceae bacterium]|nr:hypothetical protein [Fusobacteriaceae bacterium]
MKIGFDIDGTLTMFDSFVKSEGEKYILAKLDFGVQNHNGYDLDEVFELENKLMEKGHNKTEASVKVKKYMNEFWNKKYLKYVFYKLRPGSSDFTKMIASEGHEIHLYTSRRKATEKTLIGKFVRSTIKLQLLLGQIKYNQLNFYESDAEKITALLKANLDLHFDDKKELLEEINNFIDVVCIDNPYNKKYQGERLYDYQTEGKSFLLKKGLIKR